MKVKKRVFRTDFCDEIIEKNIKGQGFDYKIEETEVCKISKIHVKQKDNSLHKEIGKYYMIDFTSIYDQEIRTKIQKCMCDCLHELFPIKIPINVLVVGLGNKDAVADALGPQSASKIIVSAHLFKVQNTLDLNNVCRVSVITPGVMGQTGIESFHIIESVKKLINPDLVILIDALATSSIKRINRVIQMNNVGIKPGSGIGNHRLSIDKESLHCPIISIGVATVTSISSILKEHSTEIDDIDLDYIVTPKNMDEDLIFLSTIIAEGVNSYLYNDYENM